MRRDVIRLDGLVSRSVACDQPDHQAAFVQQDRAAVRSDLIGPRPVFPVHPDHLLRRCRHNRLLILLRHLLPVSERIDKRILIVHCLIASSVILT